MLFIVFITNVLSLKLYKHFNYREYIYYRNGSKYKIYILYYVLYIWYIFKYIYNY